MAETKLESIRATDRAKTDNSADAQQVSTGTVEDQQGMWRIGKKQELRREFQFFSIWGFAVILGCSWEYVLVYVTRIPGSWSTADLHHRNGVLSLQNGGTAGSVWIFLITCVGMFFVVLCKFATARMLTTTTSGLS